MLERGCDLGSGGLAPAPIQPFLPENSVLLRDRLVRTPVVLLLQVNSTSFDSRLNSSFDRAGSFHVVRVIYPFLDQRLTLDQRLLQIADQSLAQRCGNVPACSPGARRPRWRGSASPQ